MKAVRTVLPHWARSRQERAEAVLALFVIAALQVVLNGCASWQVPSDVDDSSLRARALSASKQNVSLRATVLSARDSQDMFGVDVNATGVQPVWIEVENKTGQSLWLVRSGTDPNYFSPLEVAWSFHGAFSDETNARLDEHFNAHGFENPIAPGATQAGIVFANPHSRVMLLNVDLLTQGQFIPFTLFPPVPGDVPDESAIDIVTRIAEMEADDHQDPDALRAALERLPCCATGADAEAMGEPINVVIVGTMADVAAAFVRRGYRRDEREYDNTQRLFGRSPDFVARKTGQGGGAANWVRVWVAPLRYRGQEVLVGQVGRPVGGRFAASEGIAPRLHPKVDEARDLLIQDLLYSEGLGSLAFATGVGQVSPEQPRGSTGAVHYYTDGLRAVLFFVTRPLDLSDVEILDWVPYLRRREADAADNK